MIINCYAFRIAVSARNVCGTAARGASGFRRLSTSPHAVQGTAQSSKTEEPGSFIPNTSGELRQRNPPGSDRLFKFFSEWQSSRTPIAAWDSSDLPLMPGMIRYPPKARLLGSWSVDADWRCHIPGAPARLALPQEMPGGRSIMDIDAAHSVPPQPFLTAQNDNDKFFHASIRSMSPHFDFRIVDIVSSPHTLVDSLCVGSEVVGIVALKDKPLFLESFSPFMVLGESPERKVAHGVAHGYDSGRGKAFEASVKRQEHGILPGSRHFRVVLQEFGELSLAIRSEVDAYQPPADMETHEDGQEVNGSSQSSASPPHRLGISTRDPPLDADTVTFARHIVRDAALVEIKYRGLRTRSYRTPFSRRILQLGNWFRRTSRLCIGKLMEDGRVMVKMHNASKHMPVITIRHQPHLKALHGILKMIVSHIPRCRTGA
ncbi:hypothetical protein EJ02DRAFT_458127, partial [Clathrospora elynae]